MRRFTDNPVNTAILGALVIAFSAILVKLSHASPSTAAVFRCAYALPVLAVLARRETNRYGPRTPRQRKTALIAGVFFAADLIFWHHAIHDVGAGLATVLANLQVVLVAAAAWAFLAEKPSRELFVAVPVVLAGVVLISGVVGAGAYGENPARGALYGVLTGLAYSGFLLVLRQAGSDLRRPAGPLFDATLTGCLFSLLAGAIVGDLDLVPTWPGAGWLILLAMSSQVLGWMLISVSLPRLPAALTSVLLTIQPVGSVLLGIVLLSESPTAIQLAGVVVVLAGVALANARGRRGPPARAERATEESGATEPALSAS